MDLKKTARWEAAIFFVMMLVSSWSETTVSSGAFYIFALIAAGISVLVYFAGMRFLPKLHEKGTGWKLVLAGGIAGANLAPCSVQRFQLVRRMIGQE